MQHARLLPELPALLGPCLTPVRAHGVGAGWALPTSRAALQAAGQHAWHAQDALRMQVRCRLVLEPAELPGPYPPDAPIPAMSVTCINELGAAVVKSIVGGERQPFVVTQQLWHVQGLSLIQDSMAWRGSMR